jgi:hypothetical protein
MVVVGARQASGGSAARCPAARKLDCFRPSRKAAARPAWRVAGLAPGDWAALFRLRRSVILEQLLLLGHYLKALHTCARDNRGAPQAVATMAAFYLHLGPFSRVVSQAMARQIDEIDSGRWRSPAAPIESTMTGQEFLERLRSGERKSQAERSAHV